MSRAHVALVAALVCGLASAQEVSVFSTTMAQSWKGETPGFDQSTYAPATQFLGIDATKLGTEALSLHLYGWGRTDLSDASWTGDKKSAGDLSYGYLQYRFAEANAEVKAGRFAVTQSGSYEQVDGVSAQADLRNGFTVSAFAGRPVLYTPLVGDAKTDYEYQRDFIFGTRLGLRLRKLGEVGVTFLQDGTTAAKDLSIPSTVDYTRKQMGFDFHLVPVARLDFQGRTLFDLASHLATTPGAASPSKIAEHDYSVRVKVTDLVAITGGFIQRNFFAYFAGTSLPSLFRQDEKDKFRAQSGSVIFGAADAIQVVADYKHTSRESYGDTNRFGGDLRWTPKSDLKVQTGFGFHRVSADNVVLVNGRYPSYSLSHNELRAWVMAEKGAFSASLDGIHQNYSDKTNPNLNGITAIYEVVGSLGWQATQSFKLSGDVSYGANPLAKKETRGLLRAEYRFGGKGGQK